MCLVRFRVVCFWLGFGFGFECCLMVHVSVF